MNPEQMKMAVDEYNDAKGRLESLFDRAIVESGYEKAWRYPYEGVTDFDDCSPVPPTPDAILVDDMVAMEGYQGYWSLWLVPKPRPMPTVGLFS